MDKQGEQRRCSVYYVTDYVLPADRIELAADGEGPVKLWLGGQGYLADIVKEGVTEDREFDIFKHTKDRLNHYFTGRKPVPSEFLLTPLGGGFRQGIWEILCQVPYDQLTTYGGIVRKIAVRMGRGTVSTQTASGAVGRSPIPVIIPRRRVIGATGSLTKCAGGIGKKI